MAIKSLPSAASLGFSPQGGSARGFTNAAGGTVSRRQADNVRAQAVGFQTIGEYNKAVQAERVATGQTSNLQDRYNSAGKDVGAKQSREASVFRSDTSQTQIQGMGGKSIPATVDRVTYTGKADPTRSPGYQDKLDRKIDKAEDKILGHVEQAQVARLVVTIWDDNLGEMHASSPLLTSQDFLKEVALMGGLANYADEIAHAGGPGSSIRGGGVVVAISVTSIA